MIYISTPIFYPNDELHLGHGYSMIIADVLHRLHKLCGKTSWLSTGLDEHGQKVAKAASTTCRSPQEHVDILAQLFQKLYSTLDISVDFFVRTTSENHQRTALMVWDKLQQSGVLYKGEYEGWYIPSDEAFCTEKIPGAIWNKEQCVFFRLSAFQDKLLEMYEQDPRVVYPLSARNEIMELIKSGLQDLCVTRTTDWGIKIPGTTRTTNNNDPTSIEYTMYVWIDALTNYITASPSGSYYPQTLHILGKDILRFHAIYWPAILMALGYTEFPRLFAHGWLIQNGTKMSKSIGNVISPQTFLARFGIDALRYFCIRSKRAANDMELDWDNVKTVCEELKSGFGNLCQRLLIQIHKQGGIVPQKCTLKSITTLKSSIENSLHLKDPSECLWNYGATLVDAMKELNKYISDSEPWKKEGDERSEILAFALGGVQELIQCATPLMPSACAKWQKQIDNIDQEKPRPVIIFDEQAIHSPSQPCT